jgi:hypothetical protein
VLAVLEPIARPHLAETVVRQPTLAAATGGPQSRDSTPAGRAGSARTKASRARPGPTRARRGTPPRSPTSLFTGFTQTPRSPVTIRVVREPLAARRTCERGCCAHRPSAGPLSPSAVHQCRCAPPSAERPPGTRHGRRECLARNSSVAKLLRASASDAAQAPGRHHPVSNK